MKNDKKLFVRGKTKEDVDNCRLEICLLQYAYKYTGECIRIYPTYDYKQILPFTNSPLRRSFGNSTERSNVIMQKVGSLLEELYINYTVHIGIYSSVTEAYVEYEHSLVLDHSRSSYL